MTDFWQQFFNFLRSLVSAITSFFLGYRMGEDKAIQIEASNEALRVELERLNLEDKIRQENSLKSDADLVNDAISDGANLSSAKPGSGSGKV